jgi:uncharacterized repeat protein (TIGR03803 family)
MLSSIPMLKNSSRCLWFLLSFLLSACSGGGGGSTSTAPAVAATYTIGGSIAGLSSGSSLALQVNSGDTLIASSNGSFEFSTPLVSGTAYTVSVSKQPPAQTCAVTGGSGSSISANLSDIAVVCGASTETVLYNFNASPTAAVVTQTAPIVGNDGNFYGATIAVPNTYIMGSVTGQIYKMTPSGLMTNLYSFSGNVSGPSIDGSYPSSLIQGSDKNFYGTTAYGGVNGAGTFFKIDSNGNETVLYSFGGSADDGQIPESVMQGQDGNFYGVTQSGGVNGQNRCTSSIELTANTYTCRAYGNGTLFKITQSGAESVVYSFGAYAGDAISPTTIMQTSDGNFYGISGGGANGSLTCLANQLCSNGDGSVYKFTSGGTESVLYSFGSFSNDGTQPMSLIQGSDGNFYGLTLQGGANVSVQLFQAGGGTLFKITSTGTETVIYSFGSSPTDGYQPVSILQAGDGNFYGTTISGGGAFSNFSGFPQGTLFKVTSDGAESVLYTFGASDSDTMSPSGLVVGPNGSFYGVGGWVTSSTNVFAPATFFVYGQN